MKCPYCGSENFKTLELMVKKKDGRSERFDLNKIVRGLQKECEKRPVTMERIHELAEHVRRDLMMLGKDEVTSQEIGDLVMKYLKKLDRVAYVRFASVYKSFEEPKDFEKLLKEVKA